jgi:energy-coupling factor transport system substrate-specific component
MSEVFGMWRNTRMVVLTAMTASLYAAILIPFKVLPLIPGVTEFRPANAVPVVCSFLFGPAAAWGAAIGNVIGDFFGGLGPGDLFGFVGNFLYGLLPYKIWRALTDADPVPDTALTRIAFVAVVGLASGACALTIGWGLNLLGFVPFSVLGNVILLNDGVVAILLAPLLLAAVYPRVKRARLRYVDILEPRRARPRWIRVTGLVLVVTAIVGGMVAGNLISTGRIELAGLSTEPPGTRAAAVGVGLSPAVIALLIGAALL